MTPLFLWQTHAANGGRLGGTQRFCATSGECGLILRAHEPGHEDSLAPLVPGYTSVVRLRVYMEILPLYKPSDAAGHTYVLSDL